MRGGCASETGCRGAPPERDECWDETPVPVDGVLDLELGLDVRSVSDMMPASGCGEREGRETEVLDIWESERDEGKDESEVLRKCAAPP